MDKVCWETVSLGTGFGEDCRSRPCCGISESHRATLVGLIETESGTDLSLELWEWVEREIAWARCCAFEVQLQAEFAQQVAKQVRVLRAERRALRKAYEIISGRIDYLTHRIKAEDGQILRKIILEDKSGLKICLRKIGREIAARTQKIKAANGEQLRRSLSRYDSDIFANYSIRLNKKHPLDILAFGCTVAWGMATGQTQPVIGRPTETKPSPFLKFMLIVADPLRQLLGITAASLADRARHILGRR